jgi:UDP-glucose 4-epimerase
MNILIAGGAGFIGSHIADRLIKIGYSVTIVDGMMPETSGDPRNLEHIRDYQLYACAVESCEQLPDILSETDLVVDCMGWTRHLQAIENPLYDLQLNVASHLSLMHFLKNSRCKKVLYLGSRGQFGNVESSLIEDDAPRSPVDVQGIHKTAAESHYRLFSKLTGSKVVSLIIGNTFGERMPMDGADIGLFGGFLRDILANRPIQLFGKGRTREFTYAPDLAAIIGNVCQFDWQGFQPLNIPGVSIELEQLVNQMIELAGSGSYTIEDWPAKVKAIDVGSSRMSINKIESWIGSIEHTPTYLSLQRTIKSLR